MVSLSEIQSLRLNLPVIGSIGTIGLIAGGLLIYFMFFKKGKLTSKTITQRFR